MKRFPLLLWPAVALVSAVVLLCGPVSAASSGAADQSQTRENTLQPAGTDELVPRECPRTKYVDCMPPLSGKAKALCSPESIKWIKGHCPGVEVVY